MAIKEFEIDDFNELISILIQDSYYSNTSNRTKLTLLRQYSEIIIRKIINMGEGEPLLLGDVGCANLQTNEANKGKIGERSNDDLSSRNNSESSILGK